MFCDMGDDGKGWAVLQRRVDDSVDFYRPWADYAAGFGDLDGNLWMGLDYMHRITSAKNYKVKVSMEAFNGDTAYAVYETFAVGDSASEYILTIAGYSGTAGDALDGEGASLNGLKFTTYDNDNDHKTDNNCARQFKGAFWAKSCYAANPNGPYNNDADPIPIALGIVWLSFKTFYESLKTITFKITPSA